MVWRRLRHRLSLLVAPRTNSQFTGFLRLPTQFGALSSHVSALLANGRSPSTPLAISVLGCSNGAEAFTIASILRRHHPELAFRIHGYDIEPSIVAKARTATYTADEVFNNKIITTEFVDFTFDRVNEHFVVKPHIRQRVSFDVGDVLSADLAATVGICDIVFAQNFLFHLKRDAARVALQNIAGVLAPGALLFVDGVDLDLRSAFVRKKGLLPFEYGIEQIHGEARRARAVGWPYEYWGLEPFQSTHRDWKQRYATIFRVPSATARGG